MADAGHDVRILGARGAQFDPRIPFVPVPLDDSLHPEVLALKAYLDGGQVPLKFHDLAYVLTNQLTDHLSDVDVLIAHNLASLNKNLVLTATLHQLAMDNGRRMILWHHELA